MNNLSVIEQRTVLNKPFKIYGNYEKPLFLAKDIANYIEHNKPFEMLQSIDESEKLKAILSLSGQKREYWFITEDGLYEILMQSRKPIAKQFKQEVKEILKSIRKHGLYATSELLNDPDLLIQTATRLKEERQKVAQQEQTIKQQQTIIEANKPIITFAKAIYDTQETILIRQLAKLATDKTGVKIGEQRLYNILRDWKLIQLNSTEPYQVYIENGIFIYKETTENGSINLLTKVTPKGQIYIINRLIQDKNNINFNGFINSLVKRLTSLKNINTNNMTALEYKKHKLKVLEIESLLKLLDINSKNLLQEKEKYNLQTELNLYYDAKADKFINHNFNEIY
jgi:anti-repressor protein